MIFTLLSYLDMNTGIFNLKVKTLWCIYIIILWLYFHVFMLVQWGLSIIIQRDKMSIILLIDMDYLYMYLQVINNWTTSNRAVLVSVDFNKLYNCCSVVSVNAREVEWFPLNPSSMVHVYIYNIQIKVLCMLLVLFCCRFPHVCYILR